MFPVAYPPHLINTKPEWKDAPAWAAYLAMDDNGDWYWYEHRPSFGVYAGRWTDIRGGRFISHAKHMFECKTDNGTLEARP